MHGDSGRGAMITKNVPILQNELLSYSRIAACKHANGRDWWIVKNAWHKNLYYKWLLTPDGVQGPFIQQIGPVYGITNEQNSYASFSPNGSKYMSLTANSYVVLMDFDRCMGLFSNPDSIYNNNVAGSISGGVSGIFSPSGQYLYICNRLQINQYNLWSTRINDSVRIVTLTDFNDTFQMDIMQSAPNGKIYISTWAGGRNKIHVINQPDSLGLACDFHLYGQEVKTINPIAIPYFPNFRLGPLIGSGCDTIQTGLEQIASPNNGIRIEPNPVSNNATVLYSANESRAVKVELFNNLGEVVLTQSGEANSGRIIVNVESLPSGIYIAKLTNGDAMLNAKLVIER
jgi:hypothetical protein